MVKLQIEGLIYWYQNEDLMKQAINSPTNNKVQLADVVYNVNTKEFMKNRFGLEHMADIAMSKAYPNSQATEELV